MSPLHRKVMLPLLGDITAGAFEEGEKLPTLGALADQFDVSKPVVRECQRALAERGLVSIRHGRRAIVQAEEEWDVFDPDVLAALIGGSHATHVLGEYLESRRILEVEAAGLAAERATPVALQRLARAFDEMRSAAERAAGSGAAEPRYHTTDVAFHKAVVRAAGNRAIARMVEPIHRALTVTFGTLVRPQARFDRGLREHERILEAITSGDADGARAAMREHLLTVEGYLRGRFAAETKRGQRSALAARR